MHELVARFAKGPTSALVRTLQQRKAGVMRTESSAVSDLIHRVQSRRLDTDPADRTLFDRPRIAQPQPAPVHRPRLARASMPPPATTIPSPQPHRVKIWPGVLATILALGLGITGAALIVDRFEIGHANHATFVPPMPVVVVTQPIVAPPQAVATVEPIVEAPPPRQPTVAPPSPPITQTPPPQPARHHVATKPKHVKVAKASHATKQPIPKPEIAPPPPPSPSPPPPPPRPARVQQASDSERPF
jgi:hypothetical protein